MKQREMHGAKLPFVLAAATTSVLAAGTAAAQPAPGPASESVLPGVLATRPGATIDARFDASFLDNPLLEDLTLVAFNLHGQYLSPMGVGGYLTIPISYASANDDSQTELGNVQLGGVYVFRNRGLDAYVRGGLAIGVTDEETELLSALVNIVPHLADAAPLGLSSTWLRLGGGVRATSGALVFGGSVGIDVPFDGDGYDKLLNLQASIGYAHPSIGISAGLAMLQNLGDNDSGDDNTVALQAVVDAPVGPQVRIYGAFAIGLEDNLDGFSLGVGVRAGM